jgi:hypothetical protein
MDHMLEIGTWHALSRCAGVADAVQAQRGMDFASVLSMMNGSSLSRMPPGSNVVVRARLRSLLDQLTYTRHASRHDALFAEVVRAVKAIGVRPTRLLVPPLVDRVGDPNCPACDSPVPRDRPSPKSPRLYECPACQVELILDERTGQILISPLAPRSTLDAGPC